MYLFVGDKNEIGVEFIFDKLLVRNTYYGYGKIWFGGNFLGSVEDSIYYDSYLLSQLQGILWCKEIEIETLPSIIDDQFGFFQKMEDEEALVSFRIQTTTFTDMYQIFAYNNNNIITIIWKVVWHETYDDVRAQGDDVFSYQFEKEKLTQIFHVLDQFNNIDGLAQKRQE